MCWRARAPCPSLQSCFREPVRSPRRRKLEEGVRRIGSSCPELWIYSNGDCDLTAPPIRRSIPQQYHLYNFSEYSGWITPDVKFYTPGSKQ